MPSLALRRLFFSLLVTTLTSLVVLVSALPQQHNPNPNPCRMAATTPSPSKPKSSLAQLVSLSNYRHEESLNHSPITLFVYATMNGYKGPICCEELGIAYNYCVIDFEKGQQKSSQFLRINPKGQIPALYDSDSDIMLAESAAILEYLATKYHENIPTLLPDPTQEPKQHWAVKQWMLFSATGLAPAMGNAMFFNRIATTKGVPHLEYSIERYTSQSRHLLEVLNLQLIQSGGPYLLGGEHMTIADINAFTYASTHYWAMVSIDGLNALKAWIDLLMNRPSIQKGLQIPFGRPGFFGPPYATPEDINDEIQRNAGMFTKEGGGTNNSTSTSTSSSRKNNKSNERKKKKPKGT